MNGVTSSAGSTTRLGRQSARAILIDDDGRLVLIKRTRPGVSPYWITPGGGIEESDVSVLAAMQREISEELGAEATAATRVFLASHDGDDGITVQHYFVARLTTMDLASRHGPEFDDPTSGEYDVEWFDLHGDDLRSINLQPAELKAFILANRLALLAEIGLD